MTAADRALAGTSLRDDLTRERFYFVMADRFENGDPTNDTGGIAGDRLVNGLRPDRTRASTTAATSPACATSSTTSKGSARPPSG